MKVLGVLQPSYFPWKPFFERIIASDTFVLLDDVKFNKSTVHHRAYLKQEERKVILTIPTKNLENENINNVEVVKNLSWQKKHTATMHHIFSKTRNWKKFSPRIIHEIEKNHLKLTEYTISMIKLITDIYGIETQIYKSSDLKIQSKSNQKIIEMCQYFGADTYLFKEGSEKYHPFSDFHSQGINLKIFRNNYEDEESTLSILHNLFQNKNF